MFDLAGLDEHNRRVSSAALSVERERAQLVLSMARAVRVEAWRADGALSPVSWLRYRLGLGEVDARRVVGAARLVARYEVVETSLAAGDVTVSQVDVVASAARRERLPVLDEFIDQLLVHAKELRIDQFAALVSRWGHLADDTTDAGQYTKRDYYLHISRGLFGDGELSGRLDPEGTATVLAALDAHDTGPDPADGPTQPRRLGERRADAMVDLAATTPGTTPDPDPTVEQSLGQGPRVEDPTASEPKGAIEAYRRGGSGRGPGQVRPVVTLVIDFESLTGRHATKKPDKVDLARIRQDLTGVGPVSGGLAKRLLCDATIATLNTDAKGRPLNLGRSTPVVSAAQRRALEVRDRHCQFPGCDRPPSWCDAHHIHHWARGGPTDLDNLVLLCRRHHRLVHQGWELRRTSCGRIQATRPDGTKFVRTGTSVHRFEPGSDPNLE